ncbi:hypothetical protein [Streptomyces sp. NBC_01334]|nr:hypothetical protein OG736_46925 [Streptomyces sp. NBC_01334]
MALFLREATVLATPTTNLLQHGPAATMRRPVRNPEHRVGWTDQPAP